MGLRGCKGFSQICVLVLALAGPLFIHFPASAFEVRCDRLFEDVGPIVRVELPGGRRDPRGLRVKRLKIGHYSLNTFNLVNEPGARSGYQNQNAVAAAIEFEQPDILTLSEIKNRETLDELSRRLGDVYEPVMIDGNGNVSMAALIRKTLPFVVEVESHRSVRHEYLGQVEPLFTRDLLLIHLSLPASSETLLSIAAGHFKAQKDNLVRDPKFRIKRAAEEFGALKILEASSRRRSPRGRILLGDVNSDARKPNEMNAFKAAGYRESLDLLGVAMGRRSTHYYFSRDGISSSWQTDVAFVSPEIYMHYALVKAYVAADRNEFGRPLKRPRNIDDLRLRPSDHQMIIVEIDVTKLN